MTAKSRYKRIMKWSITSLLGLLFSSLLLIYIKPRFIVTWIARHSPGVLYFVDTKARVVALTIDDGPHPTLTPQILDVLKENSAHATFFLIGDHIKRNEHLIETMRREGHELGNHLAKDYPSIFLTPDQFERELVEVDRMINPTGPIKWFRPGSGWYSERMLSQAKAHGYRCSLGSVYPHDTIIHNTYIISTYITMRVFPGSIIIIHCGQDERFRVVEVLRDVLPKLRQSGYEVVTLSNLVSKQANP